jgi:hypothetical protein
LPGSFRRRAFARATSQADMLACPFGDCRDNQQIYLLVHADHFMETCSCRRRHSCAEGVPANPFSQKETADLQDYIAGHGREEVTQWRYFILQLK